MPHSQFVVPQFLDVEPKIIGPITLRQFILLIILILGEFVIYRVFLNVFFMLGLGIPFGAIIGGLAFLKVNGQPLHYVILSFIQTQKRPRKRVWDKARTDDEIRVFLKKELPPPPVQEKKKRTLESSRLSELTLVVNTGGVYNPNEEILS